MMHFGGQLSHSRTSSGNLVSQKIHEFGNNTVPILFEIRVVQQNLILRGNSNESAGALLQGSVVLVLTDKIKTHGIDLILTCESRIRYLSRGGGSWVKVEREHLRESWTFAATNRSEILNAGNYEYPFEAIIPGDAPESIEGLPDSWIVYRLKATLHRGRLVKDILARKHIRVIRTFDPDALELSQVNVGIGIATELVNTPAKAAVFGSTIPIDFCLVPLLKGLAIGKIEVELVELQDMDTNSVFIRNRSYSCEATVTKEEWELDEDTQTEDIDGQEGYRFKRCVKIPKSLRSCVQDVNAAGIRVRHKLIFCIKLKNPEGHLSEINAKLPIHIFISPNLPVNEDNELMDQPPQSNESLFEVPPLYGNHQFDQLYSDIDLSGYQTPAGASTPLGALSRSGSSDNLAATYGGTLSNEVEINSLHNRLSGLSDPMAARVHARTPKSGPSTPQQNSLAVSGTPQDVSSSAPAAHGEYFPHALDHAIWTSRRASEQALTPQLIEGQTISRVPSYNTALHTGVRTPCSDGLPTYQTATSRSPTPPAATLQAPSPVRIGRALSDDPEILPPS